MRPRPRPRFKSAPTWLDATGRTARPTGPRPPRAARGSTARGGEDAASAPGRCRPLVVLHHRVTRTGGPRGSLPWAGHSHRLRRRLQMPRRTPFGTGPTERESLTTPSAGSIPRPVPRPPGRPVPRPTITGRSRRSRTGTSGRSDPDQWRRRLQGGMGLHRLCHPSQRGTGLIWRPRSSRGKLVRVSCPGRLADSEL